MKFLIKLFLPGHTMTALILYNQPVMKRGDIILRMDLSAVSGFVTKIIRNRLSLLPVIIALAAAPLFAESVFLKNGSIVEGRITSESDSSLQVKTTDGKTVNIGRSKILRVQFDTRYKKKSYLKRNSGKTIEGYIVEETASEYKVREKLDSPAEFTVEKSEVIAVSSEKYITRAAYYTMGLIPGVAQLYADRGAEGVTFMALFLGSAGFTGYAYYDMKKKHDDYKAVLRGSTKAEFDSKYDDYEKATKIFKYSAGALAAVYLLNWIDVIFFASPDFGEPQKTADRTLFFNISIGACGTAPYSAGAAGASADTYADAMNSGVYLSAGVRF